MANKTISIDLLIQTAKSVQSTEAQKSILLDIYEALKKVEKGSNAFDKLTESANELKASLGGVSATFEDIYGDLKPLSSRLGEIEDRMYEMALAGQKNTQEFKDLQAEAIKMRSTIIDVDASVDAFAQKGARLQGFIGVLSGIAGGFAVIQGSMALFGVENENVEKGLLKVQSAIAILSGLEEINRLVTEKNIVVQRILNVVMKANPIFIILGVLTAVIGAWALFTAAVDKNTVSLKKQSEAGEENIKAINEEIDLNKELGLSIDDLSDKRTTAYNKQILILTKQLQEQEKLLKQTKENVKNEGFSILGLFFADTQEDVDKAEADLKGIQGKISYYNGLILKDEKEASDEIINNKVNELEREKALIEANGGETISIERKIIAEKLKLYKSDNEKQSEDYKDLINEKKVLDINYNKELRKRLDEQRALLMDALVDIKAFNAEQSFTIKEEDIQAYSDSIYKIVELRKLQGEEAKISIESEYTAQIDAAKKALNDAKLNGLKKVEYDKTFKAAIETADVNRQTRLKNNTQKVETDITKIVNEETEKRKKAILKFQEDILSPDEFERYSKFVGKTISTLDKDGETLTVGFELFNDKIIKVIQSTSKMGEQMASSYKTEEVVKITQKMFDSVNNIITSSVGESEEALDLLDAIYGDKAEKILKTIEDINKDLKDVTGKPLTFSLTPKGGEIGLEQLYETNKDAFQKLTTVLTDSYDKLTSDQEKSFNDFLYKRYEKYKEDIQQSGLTEEEKAKIKTEYIKDTEKLQEDHNDKMILIDLAYGKISQEQLVEYFKKKNATTEQKNKEIADKEKADKKRLGEELLSLEKQLQDATLSLYNNMIDGKIKANNRLYQDTIDIIDAEEKAFNEQFITRTALEQAKYDAELSFDAKRKNAERERQLEEDRLNKKRFNAQKINDASTVAINTAVAVTKTVAELGGVGAITPVGAAIIASIIAGGLIQETAILKQKYIPTYAQGGLVTGPGTGTSDSIDAKLSNGEVVINAKSANSFAPLLDAINRAGGGKAIPYVKKPMSQLTPVNNEYDFSRLEEAIMSISDRPVETYVTEKSVTLAQLRAKKLKDRTRF